MAGQIWRLLDSPVVRALCTPMSVDDYLEVINPLWSVHEIRARIERVEQETADAVSLYLRPNHNWTGHLAGQHVLFSIEVDGVRRQRCFSLSMAPGSDLLRLTVKRNGNGVVSNYLVDQASVGERVWLSEARGEFVLPTPRPEKLLMISGGSGVTPMLAMAQQLAAEGYQGDLQFLHYSRGYDDLIAGAEMRALATTYPWFNLKICVTEEEPREGDLGGFFSEEQLAEQIPDAAERDVLLCGPGGLMNAIQALHESTPFRSLAFEQFTGPGLLAADAGTGEGKVSFARSGVEADGNSAGSLLELAEQAGLNPESGCRMGICHTCTCQVKSGTVRDLRNGQTRQLNDEAVQLCVHAAAGDVQIEL